MGVEIFSKAGLLIWPLVLASVVGAALTAHRVLFFRTAERRNRRVLDRVMPLIESARILDAAMACEQHPCPVARVLRTLLGAWNLPEGQRRALVSVSAENEVHAVEWGLRPLAVIARVAPLFGLLGTVVGLVEAFIAFSSGGGHPNPAMLADGIWKALLTTVAGLSVAIPAILAHEWCSSQVDQQVLSIKEGVARADGLRVG